MEMVENYGDTVPGPCPALVFEGGRYQCGIVLEPLAYLHSFQDEGVLRGSMAILISSGTGCDSLGYSNKRNDQLKLADMMKDLASDSRKLLEIEAAFTIVYE